MTILLPRLAPEAADRLLDEMLGEDGLRWSGFDPRALPDEVRYASTGGAAIAPARLKELRNDVVRIATGYGFPHVAPRGGHAAFDAELGQWAVSVEDLDSAEALRNDVWAFFAIVMAPDIVHWRFGRARERYVGGIRNAFQRTWLRAKVLDRGAGHQNRWGLLEELSEDALVQITERPSIGADPSLARGLAEAWVRAADRYGRGRLEGLMRLVTLRLRIRNEVRELALVPPEELAMLIDEEFDRAAAALSRASAALGRPDSTALEPGPDGGDVGRPMAAQ